MDSTQHINASLPPKIIKQLPIPHKPPDNTFWIDNPLILFNNFEVIPQPNMSAARRFNAMTRIIIVIAAIMFICKFPAWYIFLGLALIVIIILWFILHGRDRNSQEYLRKPSTKRPILVPITQPKQIVRPLPARSGLNIVSRPQ
jgi:hypothetical protein